MTTATTIDDHPQDTAAWVALVEDLVQREADRKASLDLRATGTIGLNLSLVTLYIAASAHSRFIGQLSAGRSSTLISIALGAVFASLVLAFAASLPLAYGTFSLAGVEKLRLIRPDATGDDSAVRRRILNVRVEQLRSARRNNAIKVWLLFGSSGAVAVAVAAFMYATQIK